MNKKKLFTACCLLFASSVFAKEYKVDLEKAISIALENNQKLKISQTAIDIANTMHKQATSANYPSLDLDITATRADQNPIFEMRGSTTVDNTQTKKMYNNLSQAATAGGQNILANTYSNIAAKTPDQTQLPISVDAKLMDRDTIRNSLTLTLPLYTGGKISALIEQAKLNKQIAKEGKVRSENEVIYDIKKYYYGAILAKNIKKQALDTLIRMKFIRDFTSELYQGGSLRVKKTDFLRSKLSTNMAETYYENVKNQELLAKSALLFAMGLSWKDDVVVTQDNFEAPLQTQTMENLVEKAYRFNPDFNTLKLAIEVYEQKIDESKSENLPQVALFGNAKYVYNDYEYGIINDTTKNSWTIGVGMKYNLFNGLRTKNKIKENQLEKRKLKEKEILLKEGLALQIKHSFLHMNSSLKKYDILKKSVQTAQENRELNIRGYQEDMIETKDVIESQVFESFINIDYYRALYDFTISKATLDYIVGGAVDSIE